MHLKEQLTLKVKGKGQNLSWMTITNLCEDNFQAVSQLQSTRWGMLKTPLTVQHWLWRYQLTMWAMFMKRSEDLGLPDLGSSTLPPREKVMTTIALFFYLDQVQDFLVLLIPVRVFLVFIPSHQACFLMEPKTKRRRNVGLITTGCCSDRRMFQSGQQCQTQLQQEALNCKITKSINLRQVKLNNKVPLLEP